MPSYERYRIISEQIKADELAVLMRELEAVLRRKVPGDVVELGCWEGTSALFEQRLLQELSPEKKLWLYDSFEGLPEKTVEDQSVAGEQFKAGELRASRARLQRNFVKADLLVPYIKRAWFFELDPEDLPEQICFAFLDGDFYESIMDSLKLVWPKLAVGGAVAIDDYQNVALPGVKKAVDFWSEKYGLIVRAEKSLAIITN